MTTSDEHVDEPVLAALDIGTNSFHLVVARPVGGDRFETLTREKEVVRLGRGGGDMKEMASDAIDRGPENAVRLWIETAWRRPKAFREAGSLVVVFWGIAAWKDQLLVDIDRAIAAIEREEAARAA